MFDPASYFTDPREAELARRVWNHPLAQPSADQLLVKQYGPYTDLHVLTPLWASKRIVAVCQWIVALRGGTGGSAARVNRALGGTNYTSAEVAAVEHFYFSALIGSIGGPVAGPLLGFWFSVGYDLGLSPLMKLADWRHWGAHTIAGIRNDVDQFGAADVQGALFGGLYQQGQTWPGLVNQISVWFRQRWGAVLGSDR